MTNAPRLLDKLVSMTSIRDVDIMEFSLLKTLDEFIAPIELLILKIDRSGQPYYQLRLNQGKYELAVDQIVITDEILAAINAPCQMDQSFSREIAPNRILTTWHHMQLKSADVILVSVTSQPLSKMDLHMVRGLLGVYRNFFIVLSEAQHDQLTGLANRRAFEEIVNKVYTQHYSCAPVQIERRAAADRDPYWLGMADLDHFKRINDTWGHLYGDEVLLLTAQLMLGHFRENDHLFRFGGEEFVIILRAANQELASQAFERFRIAIEQHPFPQIGQVTISIGVTQMNPNLFSATLLDHADKALYHAKANGRNRVAFYETLIATGVLEEPDITPGEIDLFLDS